MIWYISWVLIVTESPATYSNISLEELEYIQQSIGFTEAQAKVSWGGGMYNSVSASLRFGLSYQMEWVYTIVYRLH